jgi:uncharacterized RDD family membrane protein YckC
MTCPTCGGDLEAGGNRCPVCEAGLVPRVEGALAAEPRLLTPPARARTRVEPLRDIPGLRKREKTWRDEVQERVRSRRQRRADAGLPLFDQVEPSPPAAEPGAARVEPAPAEPPVPPVSATPPASASSLPGPPPREPDLVSPRLSAAELADLPLRAPGEEGGAPGPLEPIADRATPGLRPPVPSLDDEILLGEGESDAGLELPPTVEEPTPVERPARPAERARAAVIDALLFAALAAIVVYFTGRAARVDLGALAASWPGLLAYLGLLAAFYAGYFTGTTGQTPGKLATGLRVVGAAGRPPGYARAMARALLGLLGTGLAGMGLVPMAFDPAARALHDRLFQTRVVRN